MGGELGERLPPRPGVRAAHGLLDDVVDDLFRQPKVGVDDELGVNPGLDRVGGQETAAERVDGLHGQVIQSAQEVMGSFSELGRGLEVEKLGVEAR